MSWVKRERDWAELDTPLGQHKRTAHQANSGFYCVAAMQNDTIFGVHCLPFLFMTSSASSLLDLSDSCLQSRCHKRLPDGLAGA